MSREIKFRAWDGEEMHDFNVRNGYRTAWFLNKTDITLLQYVGPEDRNGVEICEGHIVQDHVGIGLVEYVKDKGAFRVNYQDGMAKWFTDYNLKGERESIEVIGNIHESSELLEVKS
jgi:uncharacterized phage protein (TIGR01671 family)